MADTYQNYPFPTMGSGWHGDMIAPQTLVNPSLASRTGTGITGPAQQPATASLTPITGNQPANLGLASRDPAFLQSLANRVMPASTANPVANGQPSWLDQIMRNLSSISGGGANPPQFQPQPQQIMGGNSGLLAIGPGGPMPVANAFQAAQMKAQADADWNARIAGGTMSPHWGNPNFTSGIGTFPAPRPAAYGLPQQSGWM